MSSPASTSLFERRGGARGIEEIADAVVQAHAVNPAIREFFAESDMEKVTRDVADFFNMGSGGPAEYKGRDMPSTHKGMNLNESHLVAAIDDVLGVLDARGIDPATKNEVLGILYSFKGEVLFQ